VSDRHPMVASWRVSVEAPGAGPAFVNLAALSSDGTMVVTFPSPSRAAPSASHRLEYWTPGLGSWAPDGERGATMRFVSLGADENGAEIGTHTVTARVTADGEGWRGLFTLAAAGRRCGDRRGERNRERLPDASAGDVGVDEH